MNDRAIRLFRVAAQFKRRDREAGASAPDDGSAARRHDLERTAARARARAAAILAKRRHLSNE